MFIFGEINWNLIGIFFLNWNWFFSRFSGPAVRDVIRYSPRWCYWSITKKNLSIGVTTRTTIAADHRAVEEIATTTRTLIRSLVMPKVKIWNDFCKLSDSDTHTLISSNTYPPKNLYLLKKITQSKATPNTQQEKAIDIKCKVISLCNAL